jgi:hypothetical protein
MHQVFQKHNRLYESGLVPALDSWTNCCCCNLRVKFWKTRESRTTHATRRTPYYWKNGRDLDWCGGFHFNLDANPNRNWSGGAIFLIIWLMSYIIVCYQIVGFIVDWSLIQNTIQPFNSIKKLNLIGLKTQKTVLKSSKESVVDAKYIVSWYELSMNRFKCNHFKSFAIGVQVGLAKSREGDDPKFYYHCAGSLISKTHVLTSARCVTEENSNK